MPVGEHARVVLSDSIEPGPCLDRLTPQSLELLMPPTPLPRRVVGSQYLLHLEKYGSPGMNVGEH